MLSPTHSAANGDPRPSASASRPTTPTTPTKAATASSKASTPSKNPKFPTSPKEYFEEVYVKSPMWSSLVITVGHRDSTYFEDNSSADPEGDEEKYTEKLELVKKQVQIKKMSREIECLTIIHAKMKEMLDPAIAKVDALQNQVNDMAAAHQSKMIAIGQIKGTPNVLYITQDMSAVEILEARKAGARLAKLELETMESEIEILEAQIRVDAERAAIHAQVAEFTAADAKLTELSSDLVNLKDEYQKCNLAWISKYSAEESTFETNSTDGTGDTLTKLEQVSGENRLLKEQIRALTEAAAVANVTAPSEDIVGGLKATIAAGTAENQAQAKELESLKAIITAGQAQNMAQAKEIESLKAYITQAQRDMDAKAAYKIKDLEGKIDIMKPLYRLGRQVRYRNNYSILRKKYEGQNVNCNLDMYEEGYHAYFGGHAIADSMMYHGHFDEEDPMGRDENNFEGLHHGITAKMVWKHRYDFPMLAEILDMASNMKAYTPKKTTPKKDLTDVADDVADADADAEDVDADGDADEFGNLEFKELFDKVLSHVLPSYRTLAITSDEQFRKHRDLIEAFNAMYTISSSVVRKNWVDRRKGVEDSWDQPWENAWMEFTDVLYEANRRQMC